MEYSWRRAGSGRKPKDLLVALRPAGPLLRRGAVQTKDCRTLYSVANAVRVFRQTEIGGGALRATRYLRPYSAR